MGTVRLKDVKLLAQGHPYLSWRELISRLQPWPLAQPRSVPGALSTLACLREQLAPLTIISSYAAARLTGWSLSAGGQRPLSDAPSGAYTLPGPGPAQRPGHTGWSFGPYVSLAARPRPGAVLGWGPGAHSTAGFPGACGHKLPEARKPEKAGH